MVYLVTAETLILVLLSMLVAGLLRSHAEILRKLSAGEPSPSEAGSARSAPSMPVRSHDRSNGAHTPATGPHDVPAPVRNALQAPDIAGRTLEGDPVQTAPAAAGRSSLIAFLSSGCATCQGFWEAFQPRVRKPIPGDARLILVTRDSTHESPAKLRELVPPDLPLVMSSEAWEAYDVPLTPYFVYVEGATGRIAGEGAAEAWPQIVSLVRDALADAEMARTGTVKTIHGSGDGRNGEGNGNGRLRRADLDLRAAGIGPGHPSLYGPGDPSRV